MPRDGSGNYSRTNGVFTGSTIWQQDRDSVGTVLALRHDTEGNDYAAALTASLTADGQKVSSANQPMGGFKHTNVGDATARNQYPSLGQLQDGEAIWVVAGGTGDAMTASYTPAITAVMDGQQFRLRTPGANTIAAPTLSVGGTTARAIVKAGGLALIAGDYTSGMEIIVRYKNLGTPVYELLTPVQADTSTFVSSSRKIETDETSLTGGGDLTADRVISAILASQAEAEAGTDNAKLMTALRVAEHAAANPPDISGYQEVSKALGLFDGAGANGAKTLLNGFNASVNKTGTGVYAVTFGAARPSANYEVFPSFETASFTYGHVNVTSRTTAGFTLTFQSGSSPSPADAIIKFTVFQA